MWTDFYSARSDFHFRRRTDDCLFAGCYPCSPPHLTLPIIPYMLCRFIDANSQNLYLIEYEQFNTYICLLVDISLPRNKGSSFKTSDMLHYKDTFGINQYRKYKCFLNFCEQYLLQPNGAVARRFYISFIPQPHFSNAFYFSLICPCSSCKDFTSPAPRVFMTLIPLAVAFAAAIVVM